MVPLRHIWCACLWCALPVVVGQAEASPEAGAVQTARQLVNEAREVERLLRTVSDRESGMAAAAELRTRMEALRKGAEQLGRLPLEKAEDMRLLEEAMRDLTHVTLSYTPVVQRLNEVNAYGAEELISLFVFYKMIVQADNGQSAETPLVREYSGWCDAIEDMLYLLRRAQDAASAASIVPELASACAKAERRAQTIESMQQGLSPRQVESERVPRERLQVQRAELRMELHRLKSAECYGEPRLLQLLQECMRACRG